jgi:hypothetical protein
MTTFQESFTSYDIKQLYAINNLDITDWLFLKITYPLDTQLLFPKF